VGVRFAATESYFPVLIALTLATSVALVAAVMPSALKRRWPTALLVCAAGLFAAQAARGHPMAMMPVALAPAAGLAGSLDGGWAGAVEGGWTGRLLFVGRGGVLTLAIRAITSWTAIYATLTGFRHGSLMRPHPPSFAAIALIVLLAPTTAAIAWKSSHRWLV